MKETHTTHGVLKIHISLVSGSIFMPITRIFKFSKPSHLTVGKGSQGLLEKESI